MFNLFDQNAKYVRNIHIKVYKQNLLSILQSITRYILFCMIVTRVDSVHCEIQYVFNCFFIWVNLKFGPFFLDELLW